MRAKFMTLTSAIALACAGLTGSAWAVGNHGGQGSPGPSAFMNSGNRAAAPGAGGGGGAAHAMRPQGGGGEVRGPRGDRGDWKGRVDNDRHVRGAWNGDRDHDGDHHNGNWRHRRGGVYLSFGDGYYSDGYYGNGCGYAYRRWQRTGSPYWYNRYQDCIG